MGMGSGVDQSRLNSSSPSSPGGKGGGSSSPQQASPQQASSQPSSPGGKGGINQPHQGPGPGQFGYSWSDYGGHPTKGGPSTFNSFPDPRMGRGASPGGKGGGGYGPDDRFMPQQQYQQPFQQQFGQQQPQRPAFMDNPEFQGYQKQYDGLNQQMNEYMRQAPMYQQLQDLQGKMQGLQNPQQAQQAQQTNTDLLRRLGNPMPGTPEHNLRYPEIGTPEFEQLHGPGANAEAQRPRESGPITTMPVSPPPESVAEEFNPETYQRNPNLSKPYMPQRQMTPEQQRMQNIMGLYTPDHYQQQQPRGMTMDMPQRYGRQQQLPQYGQSGLGISQLGNMANMLRGNPMQQMQQQNPYQNPYQSQLQAAQQFNMQRANMANQQQRQLAQQYQRQQSQMSARKALEQAQAQGQYDFGSGAG